MGDSSEFSEGAKNGCTGDCNAGETFKIKVHTNTVNEKRRCRDG